MNILQWHFNQSITILFHENAFERSSAKRRPFSSELKMLKFYAALGANLCRPILVSIIPRGLQSVGCPVTKILGDQGLYSLSGKSIIAKSRDFLKPRDGTLMWSHHSTILQTAPQYCCRVVCQISERLGIFKPPISRLRDFARSSYCIKWIEALRGITGH